MATKPQREARRRYALKKVRELIQAEKLIMGDIADVLNEQEIPTPLGTTEWTAKLVAALLICDALKYETSSSWLGQESSFSWLSQERKLVLLWTLNSDDALSFFDFGMEETGLGNFPFRWVDVRHLVSAFRTLYGELLLTESAHTLELSEEVLVGSISADDLVSLPPEVEAYRDFALDAVKAWCHSPRSYSAVASFLTRRGIPTPDGKTMWRHNQVERLIATADDQVLKQWVSAQTTDTYESLERMERSETADQEPEDVPS